MWPFNQPSQQHPANRSQGAYQGERPLILSTTSVLEGKRVVHYLGLVSGEAILGANIFKDFLQASGISWAGDQQPTSRNCARPNRSPCRR
jgi:hypothetical protein